MRPITVNYYFGSGFEYEITPTKEDLYEFLESYCDCNAKAKDFEIISAVLDLDFADAVYDFSDVVRDNFEDFLKDKYEEKAYEDYEDMIKQERMMKNRSYY